MIGYPDTARAVGPDGPAEEQWKVMLGTQTYKGRIYIPVDTLLRNTMTNLLHDYP